MDSQWGITWNVVLFMLTLWAIGDAETAKRQVRELAVRLRQLEDKVVEKKPDGTKKR